MSTIQAPVERDAYGNPYDFEEIPDLEEMEEIPQATAAPTKRPRIYLPNELTEITECSESLMGIMAPKRALFSRGEKVVVVGNDDDGRPKIMPISPESFRSLGEKHAEFWMKTNKDGRDIERRSRMSTENAKAIMACSSAIALLPRIKTITSFPPMRRDGVIQKENFDPETGILVSENVKIEQMTSQEGVSLIFGLLRDWKFASPADQSRAVEMILAPMRRLGAWSKDRVAFPIFTAEADKSQTGKGMLIQTISTIYGEQPALVTQPNGGVGSFDESLSSALMKGRPIIQLDNLRGRLSSQILEAFCTAKGLIHARALRQDAEVDSRAFLLYATSNGIETTEDAANRMCVTRLRHQPAGYVWHEWPEGSLLSHVEINRGRYLGAICAVLREWINAGEPTIPCAHDFREWAGAANWVIQRVFHLPPLMEGHEEVRERVSTPGLGFLREIALKIGVAEVTFTATELAERAQDEGIPIPGWEDGRNDHDQLIRQMGKILGKCFKESNTITVEGISIEKTETKVNRDDGRGTISRKTYIFRKEPKLEQGEL
jgi:hypothetical protein